MSLRDKRHKRGAAAFEHYFDFSPPEGVTLIQAHWAGFYYPFGLDNEQMLLEFVAPQEVIRKLFGDDVAKETPSVGSKEKEQVFGWKTGEEEAVKTGLDAAPKI